MKPYRVASVGRKDFLPFLLDVHYAGRCPSVSYAYGLYKGDTLEGVVTYGTPSSSPLRNGIAGKENSSKVLELNRLCLLSNEKNDASRLVSASLKILPREKIIISFADTQQGHIGYVYQACNFMYCGLSAKRTDWKIRGKEHLHGQTIADEFRGRPDRAKLMREKYGDAFYLSPRSRKHRYLYLIGSKAFKRNLMKSLRYEIQEYPKGNTTNET